MIQSGPGSRQTRVSDPAGTPGLFSILPQSRRGRSGDGHITLPDGSRGPWGHYGASGVLLRHVGDDGQVRYLLVQRGHGIDDAGKWQFPGGAVDQHENPYQGAAREIAEELGDKSIVSARVHGTHEYSLPSGDWTYTSIAATVPERFTPNLFGREWETSDARWLTAKEIAAMDRSHQLVSPLSGGMLEQNVLSLFPDATTAPRSALQSASHVDTRWRPAGVSATDEAALRRALKNRQPTTGMPGASDLDYTERLSLENNRERILGQFVERHPQLGRKSTAEVMAELARRAKEAFADRQVAVRMGSSSLREVLREGRLKSQFETGRSGGMFQPQERAFRERVWFGLAEDMAVAERPIYGYLVTGGSGKAMVDVYGDVQVILRTDVRSRTTAMVGDSMENVLEGRPSYVNDPEWQSFTPGSNDHSHRPTGKLDRNYDGPAFNRDTYIEAQIHGGVTTSDIAEIVLPKQPDAEMRQILDSSGIPWRVKRRSS